MSDTDQSPIEALQPAVKPKSNAGRRSKLTKELQKQMAEHFKLGMSARRVCDLLNIGESTFFQWVAIGKADEKLGKKHGRYVEFLETMRKAEAEFDAEHLREIGKSPDWRSRAWLLERRRPDDFGPRDRMSGELDKPRQGVIVETEAMDDLHVFLDEQRAQGKLMEALEGITGKSLIHAALPEHDLKKKELDISTDMSDTGSHVETTEIQVV